MSGNHHTTKDTTFVDLPDTSFSLLMQRRIRKALVICSQYDFYMLEEDGRIDEHIFNEYVSLNLRYPPVFIHADSAKKAADILKNDDIDLIIEMLSIGDIDAFQLAKQLKRDYSHIPIVVLTHFSREVSVRLEKEDLTAIDHVFCWLGNPDIFLAIIKLIEDSMNAENDILKIGVQSILLVEDSIRFISSYLPYLYRIILEQSKEFVKEALNEHQQMLRRRGRPKILLAKNHKEAMVTYEKYRGHILGIISDVSYKIKPNKRDTKTRAGLKFCTYVQKQDVNIPFLLQSSDISNRTVAEKMGVGFLYKYSKNLSNELREFVLQNFGFGEFVFISPKTNKVCCIAQDLKSLQDMILSIPDDIIEYHTRRDDFSKWLNARALFSIAKHFKEAQYDDFGGPEKVRKYIYDSITNFRLNKARGIIAEFDRSKFDEYLFFSRIGAGSLGGKARGLAFMNSVLKKENLSSKYPEINISVPPTVVLTTEVFEEFMQKNDLYSIGLSQLSDEKILEQFVRAEFPEKIRGDLLAIASIAVNPIAVRSSSKLEDSLFQPFAGIYNTFMVPPHKKPENAVLLLEQAIKSVYASVFFKASKDYITATSNLIDEEKMGIILQSVCGNNYSGRFYPTLSGVARSINYYPTGKETPKDAIMNLAYGLGRLIVEGGTSLRLCPKYPKKIIQMSTPEQALKDSQKHFYALDMDPGHFRASTDDRINLLQIPVSEAENDGSFLYAASTYDHVNNMIVDGATMPGKRIITFSNVLNHNSFPLAGIINDVLDISSRALNHPVEIEFAANLDTPGSEPKVFNYLQVRPIVTHETNLIKKLSDIPEEQIIISSDRAMGNGRIDHVKDIIYVRMDNFNKEDNLKIASALEQWNKNLLKENRNYVLIGPGRWGSSDAWLGIPVKWAQISSARVIVEVGLESYKVDPSQGTHFFHNLTSFGVGYFTINDQTGDGWIHTSYLDSLPAENENSFLRHIRFSKPMRIEIDGKKTKGIVCKPV
jgi:CheY-like chemotaxis protein